MSDHNSRAAAVWFWDRILVWVLHRRIAAADRWLQARTAAGLPARSSEVEEGTAAAFAERCSGLPRTRQRTLARVYETLRKECLRSEHARIIRNQLLRRKL